MIIWANKIPYSSRYKVTNHMIGAGERSRCTYIFRGRCCAAKQFTMHPFLRWTISCFERHLGPEQDQNPHPLSHRSRRRYPISNELHVKRSALYFELALMVWHGSFYFFLIYTSLKTTCATCFFARYHHHAWCLKPFYLMRIHWWNMDIWLEREPNRVIVIYEDAC
jgi:hypothetical protein